MACCTIPPPTQKRSLEFELPSSKRRKCSTLLKNDNNNNSTFLLSPHQQQQQPTTIIADTNTKRLNDFRLNNEQLMERIRNEAKRFIKRKELTISKPTVTTTPAITTPPTQKDIPLFSIEQVSKICEKMMKEREEALQEKYDLILTEKLNEQYSTFVKFTHEQIQKRFETSSLSYVS